MDEPKPAVAIVIPVLNEELHLREVVETLARQARDQVAEILIVDGGSTDATRTIAAELAQRDGRVRLLDNPKRLQSAAMNLAARAAAPHVRYLIRADAHAGYGPDFVDELLAAVRESGAQSVVNMLHSRGTGCFQRAVAAVSNSKFGTGGAVHRSGGTSGFVDHGHHALFDRAWYERLGGYDESFVANEDAEYDTRLRQAGGRIWFTGKAQVTYYPRAAPRALIRQYHTYGRGRARTVLKHRERPRLRQLIPPALAVGLGGALLFAVVLSPWFLLLPAAYLAGVAAATAILVRRTRDGCVLGALLALPIMHVAWGLGFLRTMLGGHRGART